MRMRERLIELIQDSVNGCARHWAEIIADYLITNGVIVVPKLDDDVFVLDRYYVDGKVFLTKEDAENALKERKRE